MEAQVQNSLVNVTTDSLTLICEMVKSEYDEESKRAHAFEPRTGVMFGLTGVLSTLLVNNFVVPSKNTNVLLSGLIVAFELLSVTLLIIAAYCFFRVLTVKVFQRINPHKYANATFYNLQMDLLLGTMINTYLKAIDLTHEINEERARYFNWGLRSLGVSIILIVISSSLIIVMKNI